MLIDKEYYVCFNCKRPKDSKAIFEPCKSCGSENIRKINKIINKGVV